MENANGFQDYGKVCAKNWLVPLVHIGPFVCSSFSLQPLAALKKYAPAGGGY